MLHTWRRLLLFFMLITLGASACTVNSSTTVSTGAPDDPQPTRVTEPSEPPTVPSPPTPTAMPELTATTERTPTATPVVTATPAPLSTPRPIATVPCAISDVFDPIGNPTLEPAGIRQLIRLVHFEYQQNVESVEELQQYVYEIIGEPYGKPLTRFEFTTGLANAVSHNGWGLWLDWNDGFLLEAQAINLIGARVGLPDAAWDPTSGYEHFAWDESSGETIDGLIAFDEWLYRDNQFMRELFESWDEDPSLARHLGLLEVDTGSDFHVSLLHPVADMPQLMAQLQECGIRSRPQAQGNEPWSTA